MTNSTGRKQFEASLQAFGETVRRVKECDVPDIVERLANIAFQCDALKASAIAYASEIDFHRNRMKSQ